jgi:hypothetical protein
MLSGVVGPLKSQEGEGGSMRECGLGAGLGLVCSLGPVGFRLAELGVLESSTDSALWRCWYGGCALEGDQLGVAAALSVRALA